MTYRALIGSALLAASTLGTTAAWAGPVLIINGASTTSETATTSSITTQLTNLLTGAGNSVTVSDGVPTVLTPYGQVWDLRFSNSSPLTAPTISEYVSYLQGGGGMFVMGENAGFMTRNNSILSLISAAGGGNLTFVVPGDTQTVYPPFTGPNPVTTVTYAAAGGVTSNGTGQWITANVNGGSGVAFGVGSLTNAPAGSLSTIFDVNFLQTNASANNQSLARNLVSFVGVQVAAVPEPATWAMMLVGFGAVGVSMRRRRHLVAHQVA